MFRLESINSDKENISTLPFTGDDKEDDDVILENVAKR
jgi:hypothetical protein